MSSRAGGNRFQEAKALGSPRRLAPLHKVETRGTRRRLATRGSGHATCAGGRPRGCGAPLGPGRAGKGGGAEGRWGGEAGAARFPEAGGGAAARRRGGRTRPQPA